MAARAADAGVSPLVELHPLSSIDAMILSDSAQRICLVKVLSALFSCCDPPNAHVTAGRLLKSLLPCLAIMIPEQSGIQKDSQQPDNLALGALRKGKRREDGKNGDNELLAPKRSPSALQQIPLIMKTLEGKIIIFLRLK